MKTRILIGTIILALVLLIPLYASADEVTYTLGIPNTGGFATNLQNTPPPYGYVTVDWLSSDSATITFTTPTSTYVPSNNTTYNDYYSFISTAMVGVNLNGGNSDGTNITYTNLAAYDEDGNLQLNPGISRAYTGNSTSPDYVVNEDGFGKMNLVFDGPPFAGGSAPDMDKIVFDVLVDGANWSSAADVLANNITGYLAGGHLVADIYGSPGFPSGGVAFTGYAGNGVVPLPSTIMLLGSGLVGLGILRRRRW